MATNESEIDPNHKRIRGPIGILGLLIAAGGLVSMVIGLVSFFRAFGTGQPPEYFWCLLVGMPLLGLGLSLSKLAYLGTISRFIAGEIAPVQKDSFNYLARGTAPGVESIARSAARGFAQAAGRLEGVSCPHCKAPNDPSNRYCGQCGGSLVPAACARCGRSNPPGANFCSQCGSRLREEGP